MSLYSGWDPPRPGWTCAECGFDFDATDVAGVAALIGSMGKRFSAPLTRGLASEDLDAIVRIRPNRETWSALEYACHVRDVLELNESRIERALREERPEVLPMRRDAVVGERAYNDHDRAVVVADLDAAARGLAALLESVGDGWDRIVVREGEELSVAWMARNVLHECSHHLLDIGRILRSARGR